MAVNNQLDMGSIPLTLLQGGTGSNLTAALGSIFYSGASAASLFAANAAAAHPLMSGASTTPSWATATYPTSFAVGGIVLSLVANTVIRNQMLAGRSFTTDNTGAVQTTNLNSSNNKLIISTNGNAPSVSGCNYPSTVTTAPGVFYGSSSTTIAFLAAGANQFLGCDGTPTTNFFSTLSTTTQGNITSAGTITSGTFNGTAITVAHGGTGAATFTAYGVIEAGTTSTGVFQSSAVGTTNNVLTSAGAAALPTFVTPPVLLAHMSADQSITTATITNAALNTADIDTTSSYNTGTHIYTPPAGTYIVGYTAMWDTTAAAYTYDAYVYKTGAAVEINISGGLTFTGSNLYTQTGQTVVSMNGTDTLELRVQQNSGGSLNLRGTTLNFTQFYAFRIRSA